MSKASLIVGNSNWAIKDSSLLGYNINDSNIYSPFPFDVTRATPATRVDKDGLIVTDEEILSGELITNGDFATDLSGWTNSSGYWQWTSQGAYFPLTSTHNPLIQTITNNLGVVLKFTFTLNIVQGTANVVYTNASNSTVQAQYTESGTYTIYTVPVKANTSILFSRYGGVNTEFYVDNVSVKEVNRNNLARIDYSDSTKGVLLTEPQSTNLVTYSQDFNDSSWTKTNSSITSNSVISPDGTLNADKLVENTTIGEKFTQKIISVSNTTIYTSSVFVKFAGREWIRFTDAQSSNRIHFNTKTGVFGVISGTVIDYNSIALSNGWYKLSLTTTSVATAYAIRIVLAENDNDVSYTGNGTDGVYIWGAQLEQQSYSTSYIPTEGSTVTRNADQVNGAGDATTFNDSEGVLMIEFALQKGDDEIRQFSLSNGSDVENVKILQLSGSTIRFEVKMSSGINFIEDVLIDAETNNKYLIQYKANDYKVFVNGVKQSVVQRSTTPIGLDRISFDRGDGASDFYGKTKQVQYFNTALTDAELIKLTTI